MEDSRLIVFSAKESLYCCCHVQDSLLACSSNKSVAVWDFAQGRMLAEQRFAQEASPISITTISVAQDHATLLLQLKQARACILVYSRLGRTISQTHEYQLEMIGFTRLPITTAIYDSSGRVNKVIEEHFYTVRYSNAIEKRAVLSGEIKQQIEVEETKFEEVNALLAYSIQNSNYFLVVEEGVSFKQFLLEDSAETVEARRTMQIQTNAEVSIALWIEPISDYRAYVCMRNEHIYIVDLKELQIQQQLSLKNYRIIKSIPNKQSLFAISSKDELAVLKDNTIRARERVQKAFITDVASCEWGLLGVTEEGKILFLPLLQS